MENTFEEKQLTEQESLKLITDMIQKAKTGQHYESGAGPILWGSVIGFAGFMSFLEAMFNWQIKFDWWLLTLVALIPQVFIVLRERKTKLVKSHEARAIDMVWTVFGISIFGLIFYNQMVPQVSMDFFAKEGIELLQKDANTNELKPFSLFVPGVASLHLLIYAFPTLVTGAVIRCRSMIIGALICYGLFIISIFTPFMWDMLLMGTAGIFNWLIPGLILRNKYLQAKTAKHV